MNKFLIRKSLILQDSPCNQICINLNNLLSNLRLWENVFSFHPNDRDELRRAYLQRDPCQPLERDKCLKWGYCLIYSWKLLGKILFSSLNFIKKVYFSSLNFVKCSTLHPSVYLHQFKYTWLKRNADVVFDFDQTIFI